MGLFKKLMKETLGSSVVFGGSLKSIKKNPLSAVMDRIAGPMEFGGRVLPKGMGGSSLMKIASAGRRIDKSFQKGPANWIRMPELDAQTMGTDVDMQAAQTEAAARRRRMAGRSLLSTSGFGLGGATGGKKLGG